MHKPHIPGLLVVRIVEKQPLSTGASREAPVDKCARRLVGNAATTKEDIQTLFGIYALVSLEGKTAA